MGHPRARIVVVGDSGSGKTTTAARVATRLGVPHVELDALYHGPGWVPAAAPAFRERVSAALTTEGWVVDGNYHAVRDLAWPRAATIVWLDLPLRVTMPRLVRRTAGRWARREPLWNENRERLRRVLRPDHPIWWTLRKHRLRRREYASLSDGRWVRLRTPEEISRWLETL